jgi:hydrogenase-4 membrane subunit HyfE
VVYDFHPLVFFYALGNLLLGLGLVLGGFVVVRRLMGYVLTAPTIVLVALMLISGLQLVLFAMWFDMDATRRDRR